MSAEPFLVPSDDGYNTLIAERASASFPVNILTNFLDGGKEKTERKAKILEVMKADPVLGVDNRYFLNWEEHSASVLEKFKTIFKTILTHGYTQEDGVYLYDIVNEPMPIGTHFGMFVPTILNQGTDEQKARWLGDAQVFNIIGCYAQTEFGHGSNVQGIETTATYDLATEEFVINSPTLTSLKWWPGGIMVSTHAIVHARLIIKGVDYGVHPFVVQLRDRVEHKLFPGIIAGNIGPKMGWNTMDNGFLGFQSVRIPRDHLLMRYNQVLPDGTYVKPPNAKLSYGTMVHVRSLIVQGASLKLAMAVTIAVRYACVRRQGRIGDDGREVQTISYQMLQYRLLPLVATAYAFHFAGSFMKALYERLKTGLADDDLDLLPEAHATSAGLKAITTAVTSDGIEECRKACGGHGYSAFSGLVVLFEEYVPACTYEGDNVVMFLQTARFLIKSYRARVQGEDSTDSVSYLNASLPKTCPATSVDDFFNPTIVLDALAARAKDLIARAYTELEAMAACGRDAVSAWDECEISLVRCSRAHCLYSIATYFHSGLTGVPTEVRSVLTRLFLLFSLYHLDVESGDLLVAGYFSPAQARNVGTAVRSLLAALRPDAVALVDAFAIPDLQLGSSLGVHDGRVYEHMFEMAKKSPQNNFPIPPGYMEHLRAVIDKTVFTQSKL